MMGSDRMGSDLVWINISLADFFSETVVFSDQWYTILYDSKSDTVFSGFALYSLGFFGVALIFFMIQAFRSGKA